MLISTIEANRADTNNNNNKSLQPTVHIEKDDSRTTTMVYWEEQVPPSGSNDDEDDEEEERRPKRMKRRIVLKPNEQHSTNAGSHPLRTKDWHLRLTSGMRWFGTDSINLQFADNGFVKLGSRSSPKIHESSIGTWKLLPTGIRWELAVKTNDNRITTLRCYADIILNPFGAKPHMIRGIIVRDRYTDSILPRYLFRPVVATFASEGIILEERDMIAATNASQQADTHR